MRYKIWSKHRHKWESGNIVILPTGALFHLKTKARMDQNAYVVCQIMDLKDRRRERYFHGCIVSDPVTDDWFVLKYENDQWLVQFENGPTYPYTAVLYDHCLIAGHVWDQEHGRLQDLVFNK